MFKNILYATTLSSDCEDTSYFAFDLARRYGATLHIFHIFGTPTHGFSPYAISTSTGEKVDYYGDYSGWIVEELKNTFAEQIHKYSKCKIQTIAGLPHVEILRKAKKEDIDLIVMSCHLPHGDIDTTHCQNVMGITMKKLAQKSRCPIIIVNQPVRKKFENFSQIIFGVDFTRTSISAFKYALKLAQTNNGTLHLFHVVELDSPGKAGELSDSEMDKKIEEANRKIEQMFLPLMNGYKNFLINIRIGTPHREILNYTGEVRGDIIVMAHHIKKADEKKMVLGKTIEQVAINSPCPVASINRSDKVQLMFE
ncbi:universal stress protein [bacterium]|nr:universal stress protein [bacterium]